MANEEIKVEVAFATPGRQQLVSLKMPSGSTVDDAIGKSGIRAQFPAEDLSGLEVGIWGRVVARDRVLAAGDRIEIYRPLAMNPREARRQLAAAGQTMSNPNRA